MYRVEIDASERLRTVRSELATHLEEKGGSELVRSVADKIAHALGATKKFLDFVMQFCPPEPSERPIDDGELRGMQALRSLVGGDGLPGRPQNAHVAHTNPNLCRDRFEVGIRRQLQRRYPAWIVEVGRKGRRHADEVISHLPGLIGAKVTVTLEIQAEVPEGAPDNVVRTVTENGRTLKFTSQGFEKE